MIISDLLGRYQNKLKIRAPFSPKNEKSVFTVYSFVLNPSPVNQVKLILHYIKSVFKIKLQLPPTNLPKTHDARTKFKINVYILIILH